MSLSKTIGFISGINECFNFFQWAKSAMSCVHSRWSNTQDQKLQGELLQLQSSLQCLRDTLPAKYDLIDRAEWRSHERRVAELLPNLKDAVYNVDDFLDEFRWYEQKVALEGNASQSPFMDFFDSVIQGSFNKVNDVIKRLYNISSQLEKMGLHEVPRRFDNSLRPETSSFLNEREIFGRDNELQQVMELLGVPKNGTDARSKRRRKNNDESTSTSRCNQENIPVLPIVGIGGVGKTTMAQHILHDPRVISHFDMIIWICVSDDFDGKRITKEAIQSYSKKESTADHLDSLQHALSEKVRDKTLLIILDDMWDDALRESGRCWKRFCAPFSNVSAQGSIMLVTTRSLEVAHEVKTMEPVRLEGLKDDIFWNFFKICTFGSSDSSDYPELERIGRNIVPKLKGSPLAAKTLGRLLRTSLDIAHWNNILQSELWELRQHNTEILPALRLSYLYLPFHLKRCFSFCALYPKDHLFEKAGLAEIWIAEGFVEPEGSIPILDIGCQYFEELVNRSFFQKVHGNYVIHDLLHDMAQLVSKHECFILKDKDDFEKVPSSVRHLFILPSTNFDCNLLLSLCKHKKLRTLLCHRSLQDKTLACVMDRWCTELQHMRVIVCPYTKELPASIGKLKHLRFFRLQNAG
ncbi:putative disease resistance RPP13-like protein 1 isoform X2 [Oryza glaberrima]|uniref:putative disease resistance RPP13-like protein 1 isoform X2 n=1 Tax=Oryza glaberrima TaxID=4538 RepID=UPI00224C3A92|nr:putative disease resistance RPP13-like protein 1 isoform X2 [Oryza glaberrima]